MTDVLRVLIADDHVLFRRGVRSLLSTVPGIEVVGEAAEPLRVATRSGTWCRDRVRFPR